MKADSAASMEPCVLMDFGFPYGAIFILTRERPVFGWGLPVKPYVVNPMYIHEHCLMVLWLPSGTEIPDGMDDSVIRASFQQQ